MAIIDKGIPIDFDEIRTELVELAKIHYGSTNVDIYETGFLGYAIDSMTTLSTDNMFMNTFAYKEGVMNHSVLPESVYQQAKFLGYNVTPATPTKAQLTFRYTEYDYSFNTIPQYSEFVTSDGVTTFINMYPINISVQQGQALVSYDSDSGYQEVVVNGSQVGSTSDLHTYEITIDVTQLKKTETLEYIGSAIRGKSNTISVGYTDQLYNIKVEVWEGDQQTGGYVEWTEFANIFQMFGNSAGYTIRKTSNAITVAFGNGVYGLQPENTTVRITTFTTRGTSGKILPNTISRITSSFSIVSKLIIMSSVQITAGEDEPTLQQIKADALSTYYSIKRMVTDGDFTNYLKTLLPHSLHVYPVMKRSDFRTNEIVTFMTFRDDDYNLIPTTSEYVIIGSYTLPVEEYGVIWQSNEQYTNGVGTDFICPFRLEYIRDLNSIRALYCTNSITGTLSKTTEDPAPGEKSQDTDDIYVLAITDVSFVKNPNDDDYEMTIEYIAKNLAPNGTPINNAKVFVELIAPDYVDSSGIQVPITVTNNPNEDPTNATCPLSYDYLPKTKNATFYITIRYKDDTETIVLKEVIYECNARLIRDVTKIISPYCKYDNNIQELTMFNVPMILKTYFDDNPTTVRDILLEMTEVLNVLSSSKMLTSDLKIGFGKTRGELLYLDVVPASKFNEDQTCVNAAAPTVTLPLSIEMSIMLKRGFSKEDVVNRVKIAVKNMVNTTEFMPNLYRSKIIKTANDVDGVEYCDLATPEINLTYKNFDIETTLTTRDQLLAFTPEILYTTYDSIAITLIEE